MTNTVTPETGRRLAAAGFPQPSPAPGQWWGNRHGLVYVYGEKNGMYNPVIRHAPGVRPVIDDYFDRLDFGGLVYLPTVGDILQRLGLFWAIVVEENKLWHVAKTDVDPYKTKGGFLHEHPAEAAALAYLSIHEKK